MTKVELMFDDEPLRCKKCDCEMAWETCGSCGGIGMYDEHTFDPINFNPGEYVYPCDTCEGKGGYLVCPFAERHWKDETDICNPGGVPIVEQST